MPGSDNTCRYPALYERRQPKQTNRIRNLWTRTPNTLCKLLLGGTELFHKLLICGRLFNGIQLATMQVFQQGVSKQINILRVTDNGRNSF